MGNEINGHHCIGDQRILGVKPSLFPSDQKNVPRFWPVDHWGELAGSGLSLVWSEGIDPRFHLDPRGEWCLSPGHCVAPRSHPSFLGTNSHAAAVFYFGYDSIAWRTLIVSIALSIPHFAMAFLILRQPVRSRSMFYGVIGTLLALGGVMILARGMWSFCEPHFQLFLDSPVELIFLVSVVVLQLGETLAFIMLNTERVESELVEAEAEVRTTVFRLQEALAGQRLVEESLRESEERYRTFFDTSRDGVFMTRLDGQFIDFNDVALEVFGYAPGDREELLQANVAIFYANPEEREAHVKLVSKQGFSKECPLDFRKKDGTIIHALITTVARKDPHGKIVGFQGTVRDITERKRAEREKAKLLADLTEAWPKSSN
jgi:PAS domain S-box-containing protein